MDDLPQRNDISQLDELDFHESLVYHFVKLTECPPCPFGTNWKLSVDNPKLPVTYHDQLLRINLPHRTHLIYYFPIPSACSASHPSPSSARPLT